MSDGNQEKILLPEIMSLTGSLSKIDDFGHAADGPLHRLRSPVSDREPSPPDDTTIELTVPVARLGITYGTFPLVEETPEEVYITERWIEPKINGRVEIYDYSDQYDHVTCELFEGILVMCSIKAGWHADDDLQRLTTRYGKPGLDPPHWAADSFFARYFTYDSYYGADNVYWGNENSGSLLMLQRRAQNSGFVLTLVDIHQFEQMVMDRKAAALPLEHWDIQLGINYQQVLEIIEDHREFVNQDWWAEPYLTGVVKATNCECGKGNKYYVLKDGVLVSYISERFLSDGLLSRSGANTIRWIGGPNAGLPTWAAGHPLFDRQTDEAEKNVMMYWGRENDKSILLFNYNKVYDNCIAMLVDLDGFSSFLDMYEQHSDP